MHLHTQTSTVQTTNGTTPSSRNGAVTVTPSKPGKLLRLPYVLDLVGLQKSTWYGLIRDGKAPRPVRLGSRAVAWREDEILAWINSRVATV